MKIKIITLILITILLNSCEDKNDNIIQSKAYSTHKYTKLPAGICYYFVNGHLFQDSCNKYSVGDTIKSTK